jgi:hypothetical protein
MVVNSKRRGRLSSRLPVRRSLVPVYVSSLMIVLVLAAVSAAGLLRPSQVYPTQSLLEAALPNDVINLILGVPVLLVPIWLAHRGKLAGLLFWPGALLFVVYNSLARVFDLPLGWPFLANLVLVALSTYTLVGLVASIDGAHVQRRLAGAVRTRLSAVVLILFGALFLLRGLVVVAGALASGTMLAETELSVVIADVLCSPAWILGGVLLWQRKALGYVLGAGLLFQASTLFAGVIAFVLLQPVLTDASFDLQAVLVLSAMALPCLIPFGLYLRGTARGEGKALEPE